MKTTPGDGHDSCRRFDFPSCVSKVAFNPSYDEKCPGGKQREKNQQGLHDMVEYLRASLRLGERGRTKKIILIHHDYRQHACANQAGDRETGQKAETNGLHDGFRWPIK